MSATIAEVTEFATPLDTVLGMLNDEDDIINPEEEEEFGFDDDFVGNDDEQDVTLQEECSESELVADTTVESCGFEPVHIETDELVEESSLVLQLSDNDSLQEETCESESIAETKNVPVQENTCELKGESCDSELAQNITVMLDMSKEKDILEIKSSIQVPSQEEICDSKVLPKTTGVNIEVQSSESQSSQIMNTEVEEFSQANLSDNIHMQVISDTSDVNVESEYSESSLIGTSHSSTIMEKSELKSAGVELVECSTGEHNIQLTIPVKFGDEKIQCIVPENKPGQSSELAANIHQTASEIISSEIPLTVEIGQSASEAKSVECSPRSDESYVTISENSSDDCSANNKLEIPTIDNEYDQSSLGSEEIQNCYEDLIKFSSRSNLCPLVENDIETHVVDILPSWFQVNI